MSQALLDFEGPDLLPTVAPSQKAETSQRAARQVERKLGRLHLTVLRLFAERDWTDNELLLYTHDQFLWSLNTARPRRDELAKHGCLELTGEERRGCRVWRITEAGRKTLRELEERHG